MLGTVNLIAGDLALTAIAAGAGWPMAAAYGILLGLFLVGAAVAAALTGVMKAAALQGGLGVLLLVSATTA